MTFEEVLDQAMAPLQWRGRVPYRTLKRQFQLDSAALELCQPVGEMPTCKRSGRCWTRWRDEIPCALQEG